VVHAGARGGRLLDAGLMVPLGTSAVTLGFGMLIALYERAVALQRRCERLLGEAELRVQQLLARPGGALAAVDVVPEDAEEA